MSKLPIISLNSGENILGVQAGGGMFGFGGVVVYDKEHSDGRPVSPISLEEGDNQGFGLPYKSVATILVDDTVVWTNNVLLATQSRQDIRKRGRIDLRTFRSDELEEYIDKHRAALSNLGINIR